MPQQVIIPANSLKQLADLLENASRVVRELSEGKTSAFKPSIPELKRPARIPEGEDWFWSDEWQKGEQEVNEALERGDYQEFESTQDVIADLHRHV